MDEQEYKKQWHQGFYGAAELEFRQDRENLIFDREHYLSKEPLRMDMLIVKKKKAITLHNEIGHLFKTHNVIEYKSPDDGMTIDDFSKAQGYASLYKSLADQVDDIPLNDITVTMIRDRYPRRLMKSLTKYGYHVSEYCSGIYYVTGSVMFETQIIVTSQLEKHHQWLRVLTTRATEEDILNFASASKELNSQGEHNNIDAIYQISTMANMELYEELKRRNPMMCDALRILMKDELEESMQQGMQQGIQQGHALEIIEMGQEFGLSDDMILERLQNKLNLSEDKARQYMDMFSKALV